MIRSRLVILISAHCLAVLAIIGLVLLVYSPRIVQWKIDQKQALTHSKGGNLQTPPLNFKIYLFNITNADEIQQGSVSPRLQEVGPYVFREKKLKIVLTMGEQVTYEPIVDYQFDAGLSEGRSLDDLITYVNLPLMGVVDYVLKNSDLFVLSFVKAVIKTRNEVPFPTRSARDLINGYREEMIVKIRQAATTFKMPFASSLINDTFGILYGKSGLPYTGNWTVESGVNNLADFTKVVRYQGQSQLNYWNGPTCNAINGTDGMQFAPNVNTADRKFVFSTDLCRSLPFSFVGQSSVLGINTLKYNIPEDFFQNIVTNPDNECFCLLPNTSRTECSLDGLLDISSCMHAPIVTSLPHFYKVTPSVYQNMTGIHPDPEKHETFLHIEQRTGLVLKGASRLQLSARLLSHPDISSVAKLPKMLMPFAWFEEGAELDDKSKALFDSLVTSQANLIKYIFGSMIVVGSVGAIVAACYLIITRHRYTNSISIEEVTPLEAGSDSLERWQSTDAPLTFKIYLFNITNADEIKQGSVSPRLQEVGPYVFREKKLKIVLTMGEQVTYEPIVDYQFDAGLSEGRSLDDLITYVNLPLMGVVDYVLKNSDKALVVGFVKSVIKTRKEEPFPTRSARDLINGYREEMIVKIRQAATTFNIPFASSLINDTFGILYGKSGLPYTGNWTVESGVNNLADFTKVVGYQGQSQLNYWNGPTCNAINGTDGMQFAPNVNTADRKFVFSTDLCRSLPFSFVGQSSVLGIDTLKYNIPEDFFQNIVTNPDNECFCLLPNTSRTECSLDGLLDISSCMHAPIVTSLPHFYKVTPSVYQNMTGIHPDPEKHETFLHIEQRTGLVLKGAKRLQLSARLLSHPDISSVAKLPKMLMPFAWFEEGAELDDKSKALFDSLVTSQANLIKYIFGSMIVVGSVGAIVAAGYLIITRHRYMNSINIDPLIQ
ncbi:Lysosome membrane protein 2 [Halotydeus destructor]|nr:Lysosome membrane protein 2 [Halotydeus destructor]